jgi:hypothetical protein
MGGGLVLTVAVGVLCGLSLFSKSFRQELERILQAGCAFLIILMLSANCCVFFYGLHWLFLLSVRFITNLSEFCFVLLLIGLIATLYFSAKYSVLFIDDGTLKNRRRGIVAVGASTGCLVCITLIHIAVRFDKCELISFHALEFCRGLPIGYDHWYFILLIIYASTIALCGIQLML